MRTKWIAGRTIYTYKDTTDEHKDAFYIKKDWDTNYEFSFINNDLKNQFNDVRVHFTKKSEALTFAEKLCGEFELDYYLHSIETDYLQSKYARVAARITEFPQYDCYMYEETDNAELINSCYGYINDLGYKSADSKLFCIGLMSKKDTKTWLKLLDKSGKKLIEEEGLTEQAK